MTTTRTHMEVPATALTVGGRISATRRPVADPDMIAEVRRLAPLIRASAGQIEGERRLPAPVVDALVRAGLLRMAVPRAYGGIEAEPIAVARVVGELAAIDGSVAWCVMLAAQVGSGAGFLAAEGAREVFGDPGAIPAAVLRPVGRAERVEGGYRATGRWPFASGSTHATWFGGECLITERGEPVRDEQGRELVRLLFFPRADFTVHDTWQTIGLRGTGSNDVSVEDAFVPERRSYRIHVDPPRHPWPLYRTLPLAYIGHGSHALGLGRAALEAVRELAAARPALAEQARMQAQIATAQALIESAHTYLYGAAEDLWRAAVAGGAGSAEQRARVRLATAHALQSSLQAVEVLYRAAGTAAIATTGSFDRPFRDMQTAAAHVMVSPAIVEAAGRVALGQEAGMPLF